MVAPLIHNSEAGACNRFTLMAEDEVSKIVLLLEKSTIRKALHIWFSYIKLYIVPI